MSINKKKNYLLSFILIAFSIRKSQSVQRVFKQGITIIHSQNYLYTKVIFFFRN